MKHLSEIQNEPPLFSLEKAWRSVGGDRQQDGQGWQMPVPDDYVGPTNVEHFSRPMSVDSSAWHGTPGLFRYLINSDGMVGFEYQNNPDVVALGCSVTASCGLPHEFTWPSIYSVLTGETMNVVAYPGGGLGRVVLNFFAHIQKYGAPKKVLVLAPDLERLHHMSVDSSIPPHLPNHTWQNYAFNEAANQYNDPNRMGRLDKAVPLRFKDINKRVRDIPGETGFGQSIAALRMLINAGRAFGFETKIAAWHHKTWMSIADFHLSEWVEQEDKDCFVGSYPFHRPELMSQINIPDPLGKYESNSCHSPYHSLHVKLWDAAADLPNPHPGLHAHIHWAELFAGISLGSERMREIKAGWRPKPLKEEDPRIARGVRSEIDIDADKLHELPDDEAQ